MPPTERSIDILLSLRIISKSFGELDTLFNPSNAKPPDMAPSPMMATTFRVVDELSLPFRFASSRAATAIPNATDILLDAWPQVNVSYSLSRGEGKGMMPCNFLLVQNVSRLPVRIL